jgi:secreted trypsin-like serine protease
MWLSALTLLLLAGALTDVDSRPASRVGPGVPLIMDGIEAYDGQFPWTLSVEYYGSLGWLHMCGGILLTPYHALTGAKCVNNLNVKNLRAWAGILYRNDTEATDAQMLIIEFVTIHGEYNEYVNGIPNDIAILQFVTAANTSQANIKEAVLPANDGNDYTHEDCSINGWGRYNDENKFSNQMLYVDIPVITNQDCADRVETITHAAILSTHICVISDPPGKGACNGDSGGPLNCFETQSNELIVVGSASWTITTNENCNPYYPSVYTRLSKYIDWIDNITNPTTVIPSY